MVIVVEAPECRLLSVVVKSRPMFPELARVEAIAIRRPENRAKAAIAKFAETCVDSLASLPRLEAYVFVAMLILAKP